ncbi:hypothetical protein L288_17140 [Sphingobium quisquiliarum P25]|uniref:Endonuclease n=1 Tax=Sphingobium quisquiliarum P25 TaxID=1329909 RepID=T0GDV1_9SPHN|nr:Rid family hydrolase [Sphingobium quisquiliarum]EQB01946.1 hypothetical protein L288_17140 [Sphingobium quisquiliarum P25]
MTKIFTTIFALTLACGAQAAEVTRKGAPAAPVSRVVTVPADYETLYFAGVLADLKPGEPVPDTEAQTTTVLEKLKTYLGEEGLTFADVVMMRVYLAPDKATGKADSVGMNRAYRRYFGTAEQPNKPARVTARLAGLFGPALVEIEVQAVRPVKGN